MNSSSAARPSGELLSTNWNRFGDARAEALLAELEKSDDPASQKTLTRELEHFITCIETRAEPRTDGEEAIRVLRILTAGTVSHL